MKVICPKCNYLLKSIYVSSYKRAGLRITNWLYCEKCDEVLKIKIEFTKK